MSLGDHVLAWAAIGAAASLAGMIWPFQRGAAGVFANLVIAMAGAVLLGAISAWALPRSQAVGLPLLFAAIGAIAALAVAHAVWYRRVQSRNAT